MYDALFEKYVEELYGKKRGLNFRNTTVIVVVSILCILCLLFLFTGCEKLAFAVFVPCIILMVLLIFKCCGVNRKCCCRRYATLSLKQGGVELQSPAEDKEMVALKKALRFCLLGKSVIMEPETVDLLIEITEGRKKAANLTKKFGLGSIGAMLVAVVVAVISSLIDELSDSYLTDSMLNLFMLLIMLIAIMMGAIVFLCSNIQEFLDGDYDSFLKALYDYKICLGLDKSVLEKKDD